MIGLFIVSSTVGRQKEIGKQVKEKVSDIFENVQNLKVFDLITTIEDAEKAIKRTTDKISGCIIVVATGGTERIIRNISTKIKRPVFLWANPSNNSLASSLEAFSKLRENIPMKLFYSPLNAEQLTEVKSFIEVCEAINKLGNCILGCIGEPSKWILTSSTKKIIKQFGPKMIKLKLQDLIDAVEKINIDRAKNLSRKLMKNFRRIEVSENDMINATKVYLAMKELISKHDLSAITIRCFDLLSYGCTACLGMSLCNDEGLVAGCEADLQTTITMMVVSSLANQPCWMANTSMIDKDKNTITLAHCTIATKMIDLSKAALLPHMESGKYVSVRGPLKNSEVTLVRLGGNLDKMLIATGRVVRSDMKLPNLCRTQVEVKLKGNVEDWLVNTLGNHQVLVYGNLESKLLDFCKFKGIKPILIK